MHRQGTHFVATIALTVLLIQSPAFASALTIAQAEASPPGGQKKSKLVDLWQPGDSGERINIRGHVTSIDGTPIGGIPISIRQANGDGDYTERYRTTLLSDEQGRYQFGSVLPNNYSGAKHIHVTVYEDGYEYYDASILFKRDPGHVGHYEEGTPIFLEESTVNGETILFGRFDIVLIPE
jgi:protocatechuate 3,4-dioxygenase beta subunit